MKSLDNILTGSAAIYSFGAMFHTGAAPVQIPTLPLPGCVTLKLVISISVPQFLYVNQGGGPAPRTSL